MNRKKITRAAITAAGGTRAVAEQLASREKIHFRVAYERVRNWAKHGAHAKYALFLESLSGVCRSKLAPEYYPPSEYNGIVKQAKANGNNS
jgi:hypothetical protein